VVTVGRLVEIKGHEYVIRALAKLHGRGLAVRYDVVGDGPLRAKLEKVAHDLGLSEHVVFHGARDTSEVRTLLAEGHIFVLASVSVDGDQEGQGLVVQEAQAAGLPVVVTQHGGLPEGMRAEKTGFVVPERDVEALAERLIFLVTHPEIGAEMGRAGRRFIEDNYDISSLNRCLIHIYHQAVEGFGR
jgi:colanic acid/amylovoran biosynthesis glycosyltransferase